jgi:preprotein translocase subunit SecG
MILDVLQLLLALVLILVIILQAKGSGLGSTFGGLNSNYHSKRGMEKVIFTSTIVLAILFTLISVLNFAL